MKTMHFIILILILSVMTETEEAKASSGIVTNGLVGYWHYKQGISGTAWNNIAPSTAGQYNGTLMGAVTVQPDGVDFPGNSDSRVDVPFSMPSGDFTLEVWASVEGRGDVFLISNMNWLVIRKSQNSYYMYSENGGSSGRNHYFDKISIPGFNHYVLRSDSGNYSLTVNNSTSVYRYNLPSRFTGGTIVIGGGAWTHVFDGKIASAKVYNRVLADTEIQQNYNLGSDEIGLAPTRAWNLAAPNSTVDLGSLTVNHQIQTVTANIGTLPIEHIGANIDGWKVSVSATPFNQVNGSLQLPSNTLKLKGIQSITQTSGTSALPVSAGSPWTIDQGSVEILNAPAGAGEGEFDITFVPDALELSVDTSDIVVDPLNNPTIYQSTITWSMSVGP